MNNVHQDHFEAYQNDSKCDSNVLNCHCNKPLKPELFSQEEEAAMIDKDYFDGFEKGMKPRG